MNVRVRILMATAVASGALLLAGCTGDPVLVPSPTGSPVASATPSPSATPSAATPSASPSPVSPSPSTSATAQVEAVSDGGTLAATVPGSWVECQGSETLGSSSALDRLGSWGATGACTAEDIVIQIESLESPDASLTAEQYYAQAFASMEEDPTLAVDHQATTTGEGLEVLVVEVRSTDGRAPDAATFVVFAGRVVVVGKLEAPGELDGEVAKEFADVARSVRVL